MNHFDKATLNALNSKSTNFKHHDKKMQEGHKKDAKSKALSKAKEDRKTTKTITAPSGRKFELTEPKASSHWPKGYIG